MTTQITIEEIIEAEKLKTRGMDYAERAANMSWKLRAMEVIEQVCRTKEVFCSDDIIAELRQYPESTRNLRALGGLIKKAQKQGWCKPHICPHCHSQITRPTAQKKSHKSPMNFWKSQLFHS